MHSFIILPTFFSSLSWFASTLLNTNVKIIILKTNSKTE